jgi:hypothetical protein
MSTHACPVAMLHVAKPAALRLPQGSAWLEGTNACTYGRAEGTHHRPEAVALIGVKQIAACGSSRYSSTHVPFCSEQGAQASGLWEP